MDGSSWEAIRPLLHSDDVVQLRTSANFWNNGSKYGSCGELFFLMQKEPYDTSGDFVSTPFEVHVFMRVLEQGSGRLRDYEFAHDSELDTCWDEDAVGSKRTRGQEKKHSE